jgi:hypothetical protein
MVEFYEDEEGRRPVEEFLEHLPEEHLGKILQVLQMLEERGPACHSRIRVNWKGAFGSSEFTTGGRSTASCITEMRGGPLSCCTPLRSARRPPRKPSFARR